MIYKYKCQNCKFDTKQFLRTNVSSIVLKCLRCGRGVTAYAVRDSTAKIVENDDVMGVVREQL